MLRALPPDTGMGFVLVQHLAPRHTSMLAEILARETTMPVSEVKDNTPVTPNHVYVIPPGTNMVVAKGVLQLSPRMEARGQHHPIDHFFHSLAEDQGHTAIGVILSGIATDGTLGVEEIKAAGGITFAQDETALQNSMPRSAVAAGCVDFVLPPERIAGEIARIARHPYVSPAEGEKREAPGSQFEVAPVLEVLRKSTGVDFRNYRRNTLVRRIARRMVLHKMEKLSDYLGFLNNRPGEVEALYQDVLINVTGFFRNPEAFEKLKSEVFPKLIANRSRDDPMRMWVLGCSTGEEAYSLAIAFFEFAEDSKRGLQIPLQIFATDLNGASIEKARIGIYSKNNVAEMSPERLRRYFTEAEGAYQVRKSIRDICIFARHNVLTDPPFSKLDLVSCRNLLIYFGPDLQQRVIPILHYALKPDGFLWLGTSETIGSYRDLFELEDAKNRIYRKKAAKVRPAFGTFVHEAATEIRAATAKTAKAAGREAPFGGVDTQREADRILLMKYAPPGVLVNSEFEILHFRGNTGPYLAPAPGRASLNVVKMLREGLAVEVRAALHQARKEEISVRKEGLRVKSNGGYRDVNVEVAVVKAPPQEGTCFLVLFEDVTTESAANKANGKAVSFGPGERERAEHELHRLKQELAATREYLQSVIEQQEAANEELQSANEEAQSSNEELQSINEELETSKEEVQSANEELATVNEELQHRNEELSQINNDLVNLLSSVQMAIIMLGPNLHIRRFTPMAEKMLNLIPADVGRSIKDLNLNIPMPDLEHNLAEVIETVNVKEFEIRDTQGRWYSLRLRPYRTTDNKIDGVVIVLNDIDVLKRSEQAARRQTELLEQAHEPIFMWELGGTITYWNKAAEEIYGYTKAEALNRRSHELLVTSPPPGVFCEALEKDGRWSGPLTHTTRDGRQIAVDSHMVLVRETDGREVVIEANRPHDEPKNAERNVSRSGSSDRSRC